MEEVKVATFGAPLRTGEIGEVVIRNCSLAYVNNTVLVARDGSETGCVFNQAQLAVDRTSYEGNMLVQSLFRTKMQCRALPSEAAMLNTNKVSRITRPPAYLS